MIQTTTLGDLALDVGGSCSGMEGTFTGTSPLFMIGFVVLGTIAFATFGVMMYLLGKAKK